VLTSQCQASRQTLFMDLSPCCPALQDYMYDMALPIVTSLEQQLFHAFKWLHTLAPPPSPVSCLFCWLSLHGTQFFCKHLPRVVQANLYRLCS
jgi:hypothetical protein